MDPALATALLSFAARFGIDAAITFLERSQKATTIEDAIAALKASQEKSWEDYKAEAAAAVQAGTLPPTPIPPPTGAEEMPPS